MAPLSVLRLFQCRPVSVAFDPVLREELLPGLRACTGTREVFAGRRGPGELGERIVASVWTSAEGMREVMGEEIEVSRFHPEHLAATTDRVLSVHALSVDLPVMAVGEARIMRLSNGQVRSGELQRYIEEAGQGAEEDRAAGHGALAFYVAEAGQDRFVTLSVWPDWDSIARATGADLEHPIQTRRPARITAFKVTHYEVVPDSAPG